jgi:hypothetical protein
MCRQLAVAIQGRPHQPEGNVVRRRDDADGNPIGQASPGFAAVTRRGGTKWSTPEPEAEGLTGAKGAVGSDSCGRENDSVRRGLGVPSAGGDGGGGPLAPSEWITRSRHRRVLGVGAPTRVRQLRGSIAAEPCCLVHGDDRGAEGSSRRTPNTGSSPQTGFDTLCSAARAWRRAPSGGLSCSDGEALGGLQPASQLSDGARQRHPLDGLGHVKLEAGGQGAPAAIRLFSVSRS